MTGNSPYIGSTLPENQQEALRHAVRNFLIHLAGNQPNPILFLQRYRSLLVQVLARVLEGNQVPGTVPVLEGHVKEAVRQSWPEVLAAFQR